MKYSNEIKERYWNEFMVLTNYWPKGFTKKRLEKTKSIIWDNNIFWDDILLRHGGYNTHPDGLSDEIYKHCFGNFAGMLLSFMHDKGIIK